MFSCWEFSREPIVASADDATISGFYYFSAAQAGSADAHSLSSPLHASVNRAQVDVPAPLGHIVGVTDVIP